MSTPNIGAAGAAPQFSTPSVDPLSGSNLQSANQLQSQQSADDIATQGVQAQNQALNTANSLRQSTQETMHGIANQAESLSQQQINDEIAQAKKGLDASHAAV